MLRYLLLSPLIKLMNELLTIDNLEKQAIIDLVTKIMTYKFNKLTREEVEAMLLGPITEEPRAVRD